MPRNCIGCGDEPATHEEGYCDACWYGTSEARLRAGISWVRGMCSDGESLEAIDAKLGELLHDA